MKSGDCSKQYRGACHGGEQDSKSCWEGSIPSAPAILEMNSMSLDEDEQRVLDDNLWEMME